MGFRSHFTTHHLTKGPIIITIRNMITGTWDR